jgi:hypothetical protein
MLSGVFPRIRQLSRSLGTSLAGEGMLVRLRSTSIALLGVVTAVGLALIVFISQIGFPGVLSSPIPSNRPEAGTVHDAIALAGSPGIGPALRASSPASVSGRRTALPAKPDGQSPATADTRVGGSRRLAAVPEQAASPAAPQPAPAPAPEPTSQPASTPPAGGEIPAESKSSGTTTAKATHGGTGKPETSSTGKAGGRGTGKAAGHSSSPPSKSSGYTAGKYAEGKSESPSQSPTPPAPPAKESSEAPGYSTGKGSADEGSSGRHRQ